MEYYNWENIVAKYSNKELKNIYLNRRREPQKKVDAVITELEKRDLISKNEKEIVFKEIEAKKGKIIELENIRDTRPNEKRSKIAQIFIWIILGIQTILLNAFGLQYFLLYKLNNGGNVTKNDLNFNDKRILVIQILLIIFSIISAITFIMWFRRAYYNLEKRIVGVKFSNAWAAGSWFVPIISLYYPYQIMKELKLKTNSILSKRFEKKIIPDLKIIKYWWILWLLTNTFAQILNKISPETVNGFIYLTYAHMVKTIIEIILALFTIKMIKSYTNDENKLYASEKTTYNNAYKK
jgi:hypothetical protein